MESQSTKKALRLEKGPNRLSVGIIYTKPTNLLIQPGVLVRLHHLRALRFEIGVLMVVSHALSHNVSFTLMPAVGTSFVSCSLTCWM